MFDLVVIGAGQLGSRYLQGLVGATSQLRITVIDSSASSLEMAKSRWMEVGGDWSPHQICWLQSLPADLKVIDLALVVTSSGGRADLVERVVSSANVRYWILEKVLAQSSSEVDAILSSVFSSEGAWVNMPRRMMFWHKSLKDRFSGKGPIRVAYSAGLWGLACNSIHFIDLVSWWSSESLVSVHTVGLNKRWFESKRLGYFEVSGKLVAHFSAGTSLVLEAREESPAQPLRVELADGLVWHVDEVDGVAVSSTSDRIDGRIEFQSQLSGRLVDDILLRGFCDLPTLAESSAKHTIFLDAMLEHWNSSQNRNDIRVPIT
ncbi:hypothetical protein N8005_03360 [Litorivicinus sp.]|nr:hypothetical protein [Litorivicinus sp.]